MKDLTGCVFGRLTAIRPIGMRGKHTVWEFICKCGSSYVSTGYTVTRQRKLTTNPEAPSCGCLNKETTKTLRYKHGMSQHPLFWVWVAMIERCYNPNNSSYPKYGAKGVYVCDEWRNDSKAFLDWALTNGWQKGLHLDKDILSHRLGQFPHYSPQTCQFVSPDINCRSTKPYLDRHCSI